MSRQLPQALTVATAGTLNASFKELAVMSHGYTWFEGTPFPVVGYTGEHPRALQNSVFKDEGVLTLSFPKSGEGADQTPRQAVAASPIHSQVLSLRQPMCRAWGAKAGP